MKKITTYILLTRPLNCLITFLTIIIAAFICSNLLNLKVVLVAGIAGAFVNAGGNIINDYFDIEIDKINRPERALPSGKIEVKTALSLYLYLTVFSFVISYQYLNQSALLIVIFTSAIMFLYSYKLKSIPLVGNIVVAFSVGLAFLFGSVVVENFKCGIIPALFAFLITLMREVVKDIEDINGDKSVGISTFPIKYGVKTSVNFISVVGLVLIFATTLPFLLGVYSIYYFVFVSITVNGILVFVIKVLRKNVTPNTLRLTSNLLKLGMVLGVIAIFLGSKF